MNLPRGPENTLAVIEIYEKMLEKAVERTLPILEKTLETLEQPASVAELCEHPAIKREALKGLRGVLSTFRKPSESDLSFCATSNNSGT